MALRYGAIDEVTIMCATYYARTSDHGYETCAEHLAMAGCLAGGFAKGFGYLDDGLLAGLVHDLGKYSDAFQRRIRNPDHCGPVDHSTAGALLLMRHACPLAAMAVAGHHAGLPDLGSYGELEGPTFMSRMNRARRAGDCNPLALAQAGEAQLDIPQSAFLHGTRSAKPMTASKRSERWSLYTDMMLTRMLFSALVDADRLDAEFFTSNRIDRAEHHILESLKKHLGPQNLTSGRVPAFDALREASLTVSVERDAEDRSRIDRLAAIMEEAADGYLAAPDKRPIDIRRCELLERCLACGKDPSYGTGLYTLTAPTGSGKTISSIAFALEHARTNNLRRVIYVIPYTSIIDQTVGQFEAIFGTDAVLPHYSEAPYQLKNESDMDETDLRRALAAENWNAPIVVTTAVQFFESLYSNATSRCRKLHNIKLRPMGMTTPTSHTGWSSTMTVPWSESDHWGTSAGRSPSISFRCRLVSPVHQGLWRTSSATTSRTCSAATPKGTPSVRRRRSKRVANCIDAYSMASRTVPPPPYAPSSRRRRNGRPPNDLWGTRHGNHR